MGEGFQAVLTELGLQAEEAGTVGGLGTAPSISQNNPQRPLGPSGLGPAEAARSTGAYLITWVIILLQIRVG